MPVVNVHRFVVTPTNTGGTIVATTLDLTNPLVFELRSSIFNAAGIWTLVTYGSVTNPGLLSTNFTIDNQTGFTAGTPYLSGSSVKIQLS
jgi:hypothetical protein